MVRSWSIPADQPRLLPGASLSLGFHGHDRACSATRSHALATPDGRGLSHPGALCSQWENGISLRLR